MTCSLLDLQAAASQLCFSTHNTKCSIRCQMPSYDGLNNDRDRLLWESVACDASNWVVHGTELRRQVVCDYVHSCLLKINKNNSPPTSEPAEHASAASELHCTHPIFWWAPRIYLPLELGRYTSWAWALCVHDFMVHVINRLIVFFFEF